MGVSELWPLLKVVGITQVWSGLEGTHAQVVKEVDNKSIAIDLSAWIVQATCQPNLAEAFSDPASQALIVSFNRVSHKFTARRCLLGAQRSKTSEFETVQPISNAMFKVSKLSGLTSGCKLS